MTLSPEVIERLVTEARRTCIQPIEVEGGRYYTMTISRRSRAILVMSVAKERWKEQYRAERIARRTQL